MQCHNFLQQSLEQTTEFQVHRKQTQTSEALEKKSQMINLFFCHYASPFPVLCKAFGALRVLVWGKSVDWVYSSYLFKDVGHGLI